MCEDKDKYQSILEKIKKLKLLSEKGEPFERENALDKMNKLLLKYHIKISDIEDTDAVERYVSHNKSPDSKFILCQVVWSVKSNVDIFIIRGKYKIAVKLSTSEYVEVLDKYDHYWKLYKKQKKTFDTAFIHKYSLFSQTGKPDENAKMPDKKEIMEIRCMMYAMPQTEYVPNSKKLEA